ncbi:hypothetical protein [Bradyrhizobium sp. 145]|uniref:hypothetical protein n=1 Tax=Bradyrhizobium sp. 145 TaxID=2782621 RepID=UPI001FF7E790|nr:hypothetical protein [Bradyrhizobium sp. 145]
MQLDLASRDCEFKEVTARMRPLMLNVSGNAEGYSVVPIQGGGSFGMEAALCSFVTQTDRPRVCIKGIYGERILKILRLWGVQAANLIEGGARAIASVLRAMAAIGSCGFLLSVQREASAAREVVPMPALSPEDKAAFRRFGRGKRR